MESLYVWNASTCDCEYGNACKIDECLYIKSCTCKERVIDNFVLTCEDPAGTQRPGDVPLRSLKSLNARDLQGTFMGLSGDDYKTARDVGQTCFLNSTHKHVKLTLTGYSRHYSEW